MATESANGVVACVAYAEGKRLGDISIPDISEALKTKIRKLTGERIKLIGWVPKHLDGLQVEIRKVIKLKRQA